MMARIERKPKTVSIPAHSLITVDALSDILGVHPQTVKRWIEKKDIPRMVIGYKWVISTDDLLKMLGGRDDGR
jgi:excisionase family DNA binding protein